MTFDEKAAIKLLSESYISPSNTHKVTLSLLTPNYLAFFHIYSAYLSAIVTYLNDQLVFNEKQEKNNQQDQIRRELFAHLFHGSTQSLESLRKYLLESNVNDFKNSLKNLAVNEQKAIEEIKSRSKDDQKKYLIASLHLMSSFFLTEEHQKISHSKTQQQTDPCLYRAFDRLDEVLELHYQLDKDMVRDPTQKERLYQGSGVGVQSGFSTILLALHHCELETGQRVIDLGSGFGRVGLVFSLLRPDVEFIGYEYVPHRVKDSNEVSRIFRLDENLIFKEQDLSATSFRIPDADVYYLYDPFTKETYQNVLGQIVKVSQRRKIKVVTKGNASKWLSKIAADQAWPPAKLFDQGNLCIFSS